MGEEIELGVMPPDVWIKEMGQLVWWALEPVLAQEGLPLLALGEELMEVEGATK